MKLPEGATYLSLPQILPTGGTGTVRDIDSGSWFSVLKPVRAQAPAGTRVRQYNVQQGANLAWTPGSETTSSHGFAILREIADSWDMLRIVIETVKDRICSTPWDVRLVAEPGEKIKDLEQRTADDPRIAKVKDFLKRPDAIHPWRDWLRMWLEDILVLDAGAVYLERDLKGKIASLRVIDGATIERVLTDQGFTPEGEDKNGVKDVAYQQVLYGVPAIDLTTDDLIYTMRNPRTWKRYGYGPVEQMIITIAIGISRQRFVLNEYKEGNIPEALCFLPNDVPLDKVKEAQDWFDSIFAGNLAARRRLTFLPGYGSSETPFRPNVVFTKQQLLKDPFDEWQFQTIAYGMGTTPQAMLKMVNRANAQASAESAEEEGLEPKLRSIEDVVNHIIQEKMGFDDIEFSYQQRRETDGLKQMQIDTGYTDKAVMTLNEARLKLGIDPYDSDKFPEADEPGVFTPQGWMPLSVQSQISRQQAMISAGVSKDPQAPPPAPEGGGNAPAPAKKPSGNKKPSGKSDAKKLFRMETSSGTVLVSESKAALVKSAKRIGTLHITPAHSDAQTIAAKSAIQEALSKVFRRQKDRAVHVATGLMQKIKKAGGDDENPDDIADQIFDDIASEFDDLPSNTRDALEQAANAGVNKGILDVHLSDSSLISAVNQIAADWASERAAEMVGKKYNADGELVDNPDAKWVIADTTRDELRTLIKQAFEQETSMPELTASIRAAGAFSEGRADMIARTEVANAQVKGNWEVWEATGLVTAVQWAVSDDDNVCDECLGNDEEIVDFGEEFPSGDTSPPAHPNCQCTIFAASITGEEKAARTTVRKDNPYHAPAGSSDGGQFTSGESAGSVDFKLEDGRKLTLSKDPDTRKTQLANFQKSETAKLPADTQKGLAENKQTSEMFKDKNGNYTPEREALHTKIVNDYLDGHQPQENPKFTFIGGGPAAGKTSASEEAAAGMGDHVYVNVDEIRPKMPEFTACVPNKMGLMGNEAGDIRDRVIAEASARRYNIIVDGVGSGSAADTADTITGSGYKGSYVYVHREVEDAVGRAAARPLLTNNISNLREVPDTVVRESYTKARTNFGRLADDTRDVKVYDKSDPAFGKNGLLVYHKTSDGTIKTYNAEGVKRVENGGTPKIKI